MALKSNSWPFLLRIGLERSRISCSHSQFEVLQIAVSATDICSCRRSRVDDESPLSNLITFPDPIEQIKGKKYAIVVHYLDAPAAGPNQWLGQWYGSKGNIGGERIVGDGTTWKVSETKYTSHFRTYVVPGKEQ